MKLLGIKKLHNFKKKHADARPHIKSWEAEVKEAQWSTPHELKSRYPKAHLIGAQQVVFKILGNRYRLWVQVNYRYGIVRVNEIGTHKEYDNWEIG